MSWLRQILRKNASADDVSQFLSPEKRHSHECALVGNHLHLFGGQDGPKYFPRNEVFVMNVQRAERNWIRRLTQGPMIPPPCVGARCVVIDQKIYSYGGCTKEGLRLGSVYRLDPEKMEWIEVATPIGVKPHDRSLCCLCAIGSRMFMFGGTSGKIKIPRNQLQSGASQDEQMWTNDLYEFKFEEENEKGLWLDLEMCGTRPKPLVAAAMTTIDHDQALLFGKDVKDETHSILIDFNKNIWKVINFNVKPSPRHGHTICKLLNREFEDKSVCLLVGGWMVDETNSDYVYVLNCHKAKAYKMEVDPDFGKVWFHTCLCVENEEKATDAIVCGGLYSSKWPKPIFTAFRLDHSNESYVKIRREILLIRQKSDRTESLNSRLSLQSETDDIQSIKRELEHLRQKCWECEKEKTSIREELVSTESLVQRKIEENESIRQELENVQSRHKEKIDALREELANSKALCQALEASREEMKGNLADFTDVVIISPGDVEVTNKKLGSGAFASVSVGRWRGVSVAVKKIHKLITDQRNMKCLNKNVSSALDSTIPI